MAEKHVAMATRSAELCTKQEPLAALSEMENCSMGC